MPTIQIKAKHVHASKGFLSNYSCSLAHACKEHFNAPDANVTPTSIALGHGLWPHALLTADSYYGEKKYDQDVEAAKNADPETIIRELEYILV